LSCTLSITLTKLKFLPKCTPASHLKNKAARPLQDLRFDVDLGSRFNEFLGLRIHALLKRLPEMTPPAQALGLAAARAVQLAALCRAGGDSCAETAAANLDAMPSEENARLWHAALIALGWPDPTA
jgi:hypothetical protein